MRQRCAPASEGHAVRARARATNSTRDSRVYSRSEFIGARYRQLSVSNLLPIPITPFLWLTVLFNRATLRAINSRQAGSRIPSRRRCRRFFRNAPHTRHQPQNTRRVRRRMENGHRKTESRAARYVANIDRRLAAAADMSRAADPLGTLVLLYVPAGRGCPPSDIRYVVSAFQPACQGSSRFSSSRTMRGPPTNAEFISTRHLTRL